MAEKNGHFPNDVTEVGAPIGTREATRGYPDGDHRIRNVPGLGNRDDMPDKSS
ncbi:hypothetical protein [Rhodovulum imhoffii]|uniref:hypothetical protein n=1 Tax=Rhodovulum imhoffii TaxID=365340 RepID=UPI001475ACE7|nr:hypothetical protein [Rhodovulum imhoffii]